MRIIILLLALLCALSNVDATRRNLRQSGGRPGRKGGHDGSNHGGKLGGGRGELQKLKKLEEQLEEVQERAYWEEQEVLRKEDLIKKGRRGGHGHGGRGGV